MKRRMPSAQRPVRPLGRVRRRCALLSIYLASVLLVQAAAAVEYRPSAIPGWQKVLFAGETLYQPQDGCVQAEADGSASGLIREVREPVTGATRLRWAWRAEGPLEPGQAAPEQSKAGDDFLARVYVIHEGFFFWQTRAINYVWSREHAAGEHWPNPFTGNAVMVSVQSGNDGFGQWHEFERDVRADFARFHDLEVEEVDAVAIMTDADNTEGFARACYRLPELSVSR